MKIKEKSGSRQFKLTVSEKELKQIEDALNNHPMSDGESTYEIWEKLRDFMDERSVKCVEES